MKKLLALIISGVVLIGCSAKVETVDYYYSHEAERNSVLEKCYNLSADEVSKDANCSNAAKAKARVEAVKEAAILDTQNQETIKQLKILDAKIANHNKQLGKNSASN